MAHQLQNFSSILTFTIDKLVCTIYDWNAATKLFLQIFFNLVIHNTFPLRNFYVYGMSHETSNYSYNKLKEFRQHSDCMYMQPSSLVSQEVCFGDVRTVPKITIFNTAQKKYRHLKFEPDHHRLTTKLQIHNNLPFITMHLHPIGVEPTFMRKQNAQSIWTFMSDDNVVLHNLHFTTAGLCSDNPLL